MEETNKEEFTRVQRVTDRKYNLITADGKLLSEQWYEWIDYFQDGFAIVERGEFEYNYIDKQGKLLSNEWFKSASYFYNGFAEVHRTNGEWAKIDKNGKIVISE